MSSNIELLLCFHLYHSVNESWNISYHMAGMKWWSFTASLIISRRYGLNFAENDDFMSSSSLYWSISFDEMRRVLHIAPAAAEGMWNIKAIGPNFSREYRAEIRMKQRRRRRMIMMLEAAWSFGIGVRNVWERSSVLTEISMCHLLRAPR